jgi:hypothetical protein
MEMAGNEVQKAGVAQKATDCGIIVYSSNSYVLITRILTIK